MPIRCLAAALGLAGAVAAAAAPAMAAGAADRALVIRTYETMPLPGGREAALAEATAILAEAGLPAVWVACGPPPPAATDPCAVPLSPATLAIRFLAHPAPQAAHFLALGDAFVDTRLRAGALATIYVDRVAALADAGGFAVSTLLGRAIAHEIGHLLLGTPDHAPAGLMQGAWTPRTLRANRPDDWRFSRADAHALRAALLARLGR